MRNYRARNNISITDPRWCAGINLGKAIHDYIVIYSRDIVSTLKTDGIMPLQEEEIIIPLGGGKDTTYHLRYSEKDVLEIQCFNPKTKETVWTTFFQRDVLDEIPLERITLLQDIWFQICAVELYDLAADSITNGYSKKNFRQIKKIDLFIDG